MDKRAGPTTLSSYSSKTLVGQGAHHGENPSLMAMSIGG